MNDEMRWLDTERCGHELTVGSVLSQKTGLMTAYIEIDGRLMLLSEDTLTEVIASLVRVRREVRQNEAGRKMVG